MNKLIFAAALLAATTASAGVRIETVTRDVKTKVVDGGPQTILVQDGKIRMHIPKTSGGMILKNSVLYVLDDKKKTYMEMDKATMKKTADAAGGGIAGDTRIDDFEIEARAIDLLLEQCGIGLGRRQPQSRGQTVTEHDNARPAGRRGGRHRRRRCGRCGVRRLCGWRGGAVARVAGIAAARTRTQRDECEQQYPNGQRAARIRNAVPFPGRGYRTEHPDSIMNRSVPDPISDGTNLFRRFNAAECRALPSVPASPRR